VLGTGSGTRRYSNCVQQEFFTMCITSSSSSSSIVPGIRNVCVSVMNLKMLLKSSRPHSLQWKVVVAGTGQLLRWGWFASISNLVILTGDVYPLKVIFSKFILLIIIRLVALRF
jgi:hypothetical protein